MNNLSQLSYKTKLKIPSLPLQELEKSGTLFSTNKINVKIHLKRNSFSLVKQIYNNDKSLEYLEDQLTLLKIGNNRYRSMDITKKSSVKKIQPTSKIKHKLLNVETLIFKKNQGKVHQNKQKNKQIKNQRSDYYVHHMLGKGGFGKVWKVQHKKTGKLYAMKQMAKAIVITKNSVNSILNQRVLLAQLNYVFLINMHSSFQDTNNLYILLSLLEGGDLRYHLSTRITFTQLQTKFMVASILLCLKYLNSKGIVHRDIKPENIVFDKQGYAYLIDLGIAKFISDCKCTQTSGTLGYMAPEVLFHKAHQYQVDFFGLGVILYEIMMGSRPYKGRNREQIRLLVKQHQAIIHKKQIPQNWSIQAADFTNKLLQRKPINRLGWNGVKQVMQHPWLANIPWQKIQQKSIQAPKKRLYEHQKVQYKKSQPGQDYLKMLYQNQRRVQKAQLQEQFQNYQFYQQGYKLNKLQ